MRRRLSAWFLACCVAVFAAPLVASREAVISGSVIGAGAHPIAGATVQVVQAASKPPCETTTAADGTFALSCAATGRHVVRASFADLHPWEIDGVELGPGREIYLNFMLLPVAETATLGAPPGGRTDTAGFWTRRLPNPVLVTWRGSPITLRMLAIGAAAVALMLGALTVMSLGRHFGVETRRLSAGEVGDMILNPQMPVAGERVIPIATVGARGASATVSYGVGEIAAALAARRYGLVIVALVIAPGLFALFSLALAVAMLVGQETYLLCAMLLVPAGFVVTSIVVGIQAFRRRG
jgi:Carboxypeptidase regulatory-like domain